MLVRIVEFMAGLILAAATLRDVFDTVVVPGESRGSLRIARRLVFATLPAWRRPGRRGISTSFAPFTLVASFVTWMSLLTLGFGLMILGLHSPSQPQGGSFPQALFMAASGLVTEGVTGSPTGGPDQWVVLMAAFCGLAVMTLAVTYLLEVQGSIAQRDAGILKLSTAAGQPPTGLALFERYAELELQSQIPQVLREGRDWCAGVRQSHASHPSLIYFRSKGASSGWPAALGAMMDLCLTVEFLLDAPQWRGEAVLTREEGQRMVRDLIEVLNLAHEDQPPCRHEVDALFARLAGAGYRVRADADKEGFVSQRARHAACISRMAAHLGTPDAGLLPPS